MMIALMVAIGAGCAVVLACAVTVAYWLPRPRRFGFDVREE